MSSIAIIRIDPSKADPHFIAQYFHQPSFIDKVVADYKTGTGVPRIVLKNFKRIILHIPSDIFEQKELANLFDDIDKELLTFQRKLAKYRRLKQGMMQKLLTGEIRLI